MATNRATFGAPPQLDWIPVERCFIDRRYQRTIESRRSQALILGIKTEFRWELFGAVMAGRHDEPDGPRYEIADGQHRIEAARTLGIAEVPAVVFPAATVEGMAAIFVQANRDRVAVSPYQLYHAKLLAGDSEAKRVDAICRAYGLSIPRTTTVKANFKPGETLALGTIEALLRQHGPELTKLTVGAIARPWSQKPGAVGAFIMRAAGRMITGSSKPERAAWQIELVLRRMDPAALHRKVLARCAITRETQIHVYETILAEEIAGEQVDPDTPEPPPEKHTPTAPEPKPTDRISFASLRSKKPAGATAVAENRGAAPARHHAARLARNAALNSATIVPGGGKPSLASCNVSRLAAAPLSSAVPVGRGHTPRQAEPKRPGGITAEQEAIVRRMWDAGASYAALAKAIGKSGPGSIQWIVTKLGLPPRADKPKRSAIVGPRPMSALMAKVLTAAAHLHDGGKPITHSALKTATGIDPRTLAAQLRHLVETGHLRRMSGIQPLYELARRLDGTPGIQTAIEQGMRIETRIIDGKEHQVKVYPSAHVAPGFGQRLSRTGS